MKPLQGNVKERRGDGIRDAGYGIRDARCGVRPFDNASALRFLRVNLIQHDKG